MHVGAARHQGRADRRRRRLDRRLRMRRPSGRGRHPRPRADPARGRFDHHSADRLGRLRRRARPGRRAGAGRGRRQHGHALHGHPRGAGPRRRQAPPGRGRRAPDRTGAAQFQKHLARAQERAHRAGGRPGAAARRRVRQRRAAGGRHARPRRLQQRRLERRRVERRHGAGPDLRHSDGGRTGHAHRRRGRAPDRRPPHRLAGGLKNDSVSTSRPSYTHKKFKETDMELATTPPAELAPAAASPQDRMWMLVFAFAFLGLLVDGADLMFLSFSLSSLKAEFGLTNVQAGSLGSITLAGMVVGGLASGWTADRFGRVRTVVWTIVLFSVGTAMLGLTHSYAQFAAARFIAALGLGAEYIVCNTMMSEYVPTKFRTTVLATVQSAWSVGYIAAALLSSWILPTYGWRWLFLIAIVPVVMAIAMRRHVKESPAWQASDARRRARVAASRAAAELAGRAASGGNAVSGDHLGDAAAAVPVKAGLRKIFADPVQRKMFLLWAISSSALQFGYFGVNNWMPTYLEKELHISFASMTGYMVCNYLAMIVGKVIAGWLADRLGRRLVFSAGAIGTALFLPLIVYYHTPDLILPMLVFFGFLYGIPYGVNATYMTESFPTDVRGTAVGGSYNIGRIGAAFAPAVIGYLATGGSIGLGFVVMGVAYFLAGAIPGLFIKEKQFDPIQ